MTGNTAWHRWSAKLAISLGRDFERACLPFLRLLWPDMVVPTPFSKWDRQGIDLLAFGQTDVLECVVQCKTSQSKSLGTDDVRQALESIASFETSSLTCQTYLLVINGDGRSTEYAAEVRPRLRALVGSGKAIRAELWNRHELMNNAFDRMREILLRCLAQRARERSDLLRSLFRFGSVNLRSVPVAEDRLVLKPGAPCERITVQASSTRNLADLLQDNTRSRWTLLTGVFGAGKTTAALDAASVGARTAIFVSAAEIREDTLFHGTTMLAQEIAGSLKVFEAGAQPIDGFYVIDEGDEEIFSQLAGPALASILRSEEPDHFLLVDGLDENRAFLNPIGMQHFNNCLADIKCPIVLTTRYEHLSTMFGNFEALLEGLGRKRRSAQPARLLTLSPWSAAEVSLFAQQAALLAVGEESRAIASFASALNGDRLNELYGDLPYHPLFLQFILDDVCNGGLRSRTRTQLVESWIRRKIWRDMDSHGIPSDLPIDRYEWLENMVLFMEAVAASMTTGSDNVQLLEYADAAQIESLSTPIFGRPIPTLTLLLYTVLVPKAMRVGRKLEVGFALRLLQEYFLARHLARNHVLYGGYPDSVKSLVHDLGNRF